LDKNKKKLLIDKVYSQSILESYKPAEDNKGPVIGSFKVKGMTVENTVNQNGRWYTERTWSQPSAFGKGGKFINEQGKLKPTTLVGNVDHPTNDLDVFLTEGALIWTDVKRNQDGSWDGAANIIDTPAGKIAKTYLDYAKQYGDSGMLGVSSRAYGETRQATYNGQVVEEVIPESFELMAFDFVYNPSFASAKVLTESAKSNLKILTESIRNLAKDDEVNKTTYDKVAESIENMKYDEPKKVFKIEDVEVALDDISNLTIKELAEEIVKKYITHFTEEELEVMQLDEKELFDSVVVMLEKGDMMKEKVKKEKEENKTSKEEVKESKKSINESEEDLEKEDETKLEDEENQDEPSKEDEVEEENKEDEEADADLVDEEKELTPEEQLREDIKLMFEELEGNLRNFIAEELKALLSPVEDFVDEQPEVEENEEPTEDEVEDEEGNEAEDLLAELTDEDIADLSEEELEYLLKLAEEK